MRQYNMATIPTQQSHLLGLPTELRLKIYEYVFEGHIIDFHHFSPLDEKQAPPGLLITCKQVYIEAVEVFYSSATIGFDSFSAVGLVISSYVPSYRLNGMKGVELDCTQLCGDQDLCAKMTEEECGMHLYARTIAESQLQGMAADTLAKKVRVKCSCCEKHREH